LKLRVGLRGPGWRYEAHPLRSEAKHNICRLIYHSAHLILLFPSLPASFPPSYNTAAVSVTTTDCFSFRNLRLASFKRSWQLSPDWFAKFPSYLIRGTDILSCAMRKYYSFASTFFLTSFLSGFTYFYSYYSWWMDHAEFNILVTYVLTLYYLFQNYPFFRRENIFRKNFIVDYSR